MTTIPAELTWREAYWDDAQAKVAFQGFARDLFGLEFGAWESAGYWDEDYRPFSLFDARGRVVASVCLYSLDLIVAGRKVRAGQLSAVGTRPEWRRRGLAQRLAVGALARSAEWGHPFQYLFANDEALALYARLGFTPLAERVTSLTFASIASRAGARRLDPSAADDLRLAQRVVGSREPVSLRLGVVSERLAMYFVLVAMRDALWWIEPLDLLVLARREEGELTIFDVIGPRMVEAAMWLPYLVTPTDRSVVLRFEVDRLGDLRALGDPQERPLLGNNLHVRGAFPLNAPVVFPITAQA